MNQLNLFEPPRPAPVPRPPNIPFIRKHLRRQLAIARAAELLPWGAADADYWADFFPELTRLLPEEEGAALREAFAAELARLRAVG